MELFSFKLVGCILIYEHHVLCIIWLENFALGFVYHMPESTGAALGPPHLHRRAPTRHVVVNTADHALVPHRFFFFFSSVCGFVPNRAESDRIG